LKELGLDENTLVMFTSDNGPTYDRLGGSDSDFFESAGPFRGLKGSAYEGGIRVPGIAVWPGKIEAGSTNDTPVGGIDMLPTLAEIGQVGEYKTRPLDGTSIRKAFEGKHVKRSKPLYWHFNAARTGPKVAIRMGNWKLLATVTGEAIKPYGDILEKNQQMLKSAELDQFELYNLKKDPNETQDLASKKTAKLE
ncbi:MAG: sulfatase-like hydrolase/transferase, partial [Planctomycetaceae bacterium]|nr:sulfatase-like hydrolase/transferase [Planctomycetaceae bacterium]